MTRSSSNPLAAAMASNVSPRDVERGDTALVLMRAGYRAADIAAQIDEVEGLVLSVTTRRATSIAVAMLVAGAAANRSDLPVGKDATSATEAIRHSITPPHPRRPFSA